MAVAAAAGAVVGWIVLNKQLSVAASPSRVPVGIEPWHWDRKMTGQSR